MIKYRGKIGSTLWEVNTDPDDTLGEDGDFCLNLAQSTLYGPKTAGVWTKYHIATSDVAAPFLFLGTTAPDNSVGKDSDIYINITPSNGKVSLYQKTAGIWVFQVSLIGLPF